ncbi:TIM barrel protein [Roseobacter sp. N2S]|uniref:hydroxypyruvate isomerase family protein n=1 Tax=Roseobacter sp. N2S TaxID=2663844 RepID=UPI00285FEB9D|nr:TIM barrel protein [Roseobacter sp. N2S]MDR6264978.1 hydroxypyruvate isomerase [Roseobacter sp. N2S]
MRLIANISMMFKEVALHERLHAAQAAGFAGVEIQFPEAQDIAALKRASDELRMPITLINVPRGTGDAVGLAALPGQVADYHAAVETCAEQAATLRVRKVNVLAGRPPKGADPADCRATLIRNLIHTADVMAALDVRVMVEPVNLGDVPGFFLSGLGNALALLEEINHPNLFLQFDYYHMSITEPDLPAAIRRAGSRIGHVQFADTQGRNEPGTGTVDFAAAFKALRETGYDAEVSAEYNPRGTTAQGLEWMNDFKRMMA